MGVSAGRLSQSRSPQEVLRLRSRVPARRHHGSFLPRAAAATGTPSLAGSKPLVVESLVGDDGGPPRFISPLHQSMITNNREELPLMIYLPGIDGTGLAASRQFPSLLARFDLRAFITPIQDRTPFADKVALVRAYLAEEVPRHPPTRPIYLLGESFGGVLAVAVAAECPELVDRVVLVNPATSFPRSVWPLIGPLLPQVPAEMYPLLPLALAPVLGNPVNLLAAGVDSSTPVQAQAAQLVQTALGLLQQLPRLADILPADTLAWKLDLLAQGNAYIAPLLPKVQQRVLVLVSDGDILIPSREEGPRLQRELPRAHTRLMRGHSHALLQEAGVDLFQILEEEGFYVTARRMSAPVKRRGTARSQGLAAPIELPTLVEVDRYAQRTTATIRRLNSPVFISTSPDGSRALGLGHIPSGRPLVLVGNHQTLALELGPLCEQFLKERGVLLRGLAHPVIFSASNSSSSSSGGAAEGSGEYSGDEGPSGMGTSRGPSGNGAAAGENSSGSSSSNGGNGSGGPISPFDAIPAFGALFSGRGLNPRPDPSGRLRPTDGRSSFRDFMTTFGAVPVSGFNFHRLLQNGEAVLLFPGGVREAYKRKGEEYQLFWPDRTEFIRMAARFGATIVPFAGIGIDDGLELVLDSSEVENLPVLGDFVRRNSGNVPQARRGVVAAASEDEKFVAPLALPKFPPSRMYYLFQKPITLDSADMKDKAKCEELYLQVKGSVQEGLEWLQHKRAEDPYADFGKRAFFETIWNGRKQAPTFPLQ